MKGIMKATYVSLALVAMVCAMVAVGVSFVSDESSASYGGNLTDDITWTFDSGVLTISGEGAMPDWDGGYPNSIYGLAEGTYQPWAWYAPPRSNTAQYGSQFMNLNKIVIGDGITYVGDNSFNGHFINNRNKSTTIVIEGDDVPEFGENILGETVDGNSIKYALRVEMSNLTAENVAKIAPNVFGWKYDSDAKKLYVFGGGDTEINGQTCTNDYGWDITRVWFSNEIASIEISGVKVLRNSSAFNNNSSTPLFIGYDVLLFLSEDAVSGLTSLRVDGEECLVKSGEKNLGYVKNGDDLYLYSIPSDVTGLVASDFDEDMVVFAPLLGINTLKSLVLPSGLEHAHFGEFNGKSFSSLEYLAIGSDIERITSGYFYQLNTSSIVRYNSLSSLKVLDLSEVDLSSIPTLSASIEEITLPSTITSIGSEFQSSNLKKINLENIVSIAAGAFYGCKNLTEVNLSEKCTSIGVAAFSGTAITSFIIPKYLTIENNPFSNTSLKSIILAEGYEGQNTIIDGSVYANEGKTLVHAFYDGSPTYIISDGVEVIATQAFRDSPYVNVVFGEGVTTVNAIAFYNAKVKNVYFKNSDALVSIDSSQWSASFYNVTLDVAYYVGDLDPATLDSTRFSGKTIKVDGAEDQFSIQFVTNGGLPIDAVTYEIYLENDLVLPTPVKAGFIFLAWYYDEGLTESVDSTILVAGTFGDLVLYAAYASIDDLVFGADVLGFSGPTVIITIDSASKPAGNVIVKYSEYIDVAEGTILFPFLVGSVAVDDGMDIITFSAASGKTIESCSVTFCYTLGNTVVYTPLSYANAPATMAKMDLTADSGLTVKFDSNIITAGDKVAFGTYVVEVSGDQAVTVNGVVWTNGDKLFYYGQKIVVSAVTE